MLPVSDRSIPPITSDARWNSDVSSAATLATGATGRAGASTTSPDAPPAPTAGSPTSPGDSVLRGAAIIRLPSLQPIDGRTGNNGTVTGSTGSGRTMKLSQTARKTRLELLA